MSSNNGTSFKKKQKSFLSFPTASELTGVGGKGGARWCGLYLWLKKERKKTNMQKKYFEMPQKILTVFLTKSSCKVLSYMLCILQMTTKVPRDSATTYTHTQKKSITHTKSITATQQTNYIKITKQAFD